MKFSYAVAAVIAAAASVQAVETNGQRMARGLKPLPPRNLHHRASRTNEARGAKPSGTSGGDYNCNTGKVQCCNQVSKANDSVISTILGLLGIGGVADDVLVGLKCSPLSVVGLGSGNSCSQRPVCCENNSEGGLISIGCIPTNVFWEKISVTL
ncbi:hypothetical protein GSI_08064 [Ganoderma sinense ZZ0214-1]|uniref:Hydrophobin n=1 Tax=Ganoderma sinense ZZ0214-1 TaxID=1077348 RepID=A0A2G8S7Z8_9APHY|nr:hypothetical protein GSI_08064 [Ganoderma sinense ZZ0214-1]